MLVKGDKLPVIRGVSSGDPMDCMLTVINTTVLIRKIGERTDLKCSHQNNNNKTVILCVCGGWRCSLTLLW